MYKLLGILYGLVLFTLLSPTSLVLLYMALTERNLWCGIGAVVIAAVIAVPFIMALNHKSNKSPF